MTTFPGPRTTLLSLAMIFPAAVFAQTAADGDHDSLRELRALYEKAVDTDDIGLLKPHLDPDFSAVMVTGRSIRGFDELSQYWSDIKDLIGEGGTYKVAVKPVEESSIYGDIAVARGTTSDHVVTGSGATYEFTGEWTAVLRRTDGQWKLVRVHGSMDPIDNPFVKSTVTWTAVWAAAAAAVVGVLVGWIAARVRRKGEA